MRLLKASLVTATVFAAGMAMASEDHALIDAADPREIVAKAFRNLYGFSSVQRVQISSGAPSERGFLRSAQVVRAGSATGLNRMLVRFSGPADLRGVGLLLTERKNFQYDAFLYQPILKKVRRVSVYQRHDSFFGTDLAFEDLEGKRAEQWSARLLRDEDLSGRKTWVIETRPTNFPSGYERIVGWFDQEFPIVLKFEFYLRGKEEIHKTLHIEVANVVEKGGYFIPTLLHFRGRAGSETVVRVTEIEIRESFAKKIFSPSALERGSEKRDALQN